MPIIVDWAPASSILDNPDYRPFEPRPWRPPETLRPQPGDTITIHDGSRHTVWSVKRREKDRRVWVQVERGGELIDIGQDECIPAPALPPQVPTAIDIWHPLYFQDETVFVLGGGPSLAEFDPERLRGRSIIAVNSSYRLVQGMNAVLCFSDEAWALDRPQAIEEWDGPIVSFSADVKARWPAKVTLAEVARGPDFPVGMPGKIRTGQSSGHMGVGLGVALGARRLVLLGYDMRHSEDGRSHWHNDYSHRSPPALFTQHFRPTFTGWNAMAARAGCEILNATPGTALEEFPLVSIDDMLGR